MLYKCNYCNHEFNLKDIEDENFICCSECGDYDVEEIEIDCSGCSMFVGAICTAPKCVYGKFDK